MGSIYMLIEREALRCEDQVIKIGRSDNVFARIKNYPKGSEVIYTARVTDSESAERMLIKRLSISCNRRRDMGLEYFEGDLEEMTAVFHTVVAKFKTCARCWS